MKLSRIILPLTVALVASLLTGCPRKGPVKVTDVHKPGPTAQPATPPPDISTKPFNPVDATPIATPTTTPVVKYNTPTSDINLADYTQDPAALAAYTVHFAFDSSAIPEADQANVASVAQALTSDPNAKLLIEGHCDERGTEEYNRSLGERRALAVREALGAKVDAMRVKTVSYGKDKPEDSGHEEAAWAKNRRAVFILLHPKTVAQ